MCICYATTSCSSYYWDNDCEPFGIIQEKMSQSPAAFFILCHRALYLQRVTFAVKPHRQLADHGRSNGLDQVIIMLLKTKVSELRVALGECWFCLFSSLNAAAKFTAKVASIGWGDAWVCANGGESTKLPFPLSKLGLVKTFGRSRSLGCHIIIINIIIIILLMMIVIK